jgi:hypothetical protein
MLPPFPTLKMQASRFSEVSVNICQTTQLNIPELILHSDCYENVIFQHFNFDYIKHHSFPIDVT